MKRERLNFFFGHHKGATTWVRAIIARVCQITGDCWAVFDNPSQFDHDLGRAIATRHLSFVAFTNAARSHLRNLPEFRGFHLVRDPRDILVSAYFSHLHSHPTEGWAELENHRERLRTLSLEEGLRAEMEFSAAVFRDMETWDYEQPHVLELRFEELVANPYQTMLEAFGFLGLLDEEPPTTRAAAILALNRATRFLDGRVKGHLRPFGRLSRVPAEVLLGAVYEKRFSRLAGGRKRGEVSLQSHYRKGEPGDWRNHFTAPVASRFRERHGALVERLGYEW